MNTYAPLHPGVYFAKTKPPLTHAELAEQLNICRTTLWRFMLGKSRLTPDLARQLAKLTDEPARAWIERQATYDVWQVEKPRS